MSPMPAQQRSLPLPALLLAPLAALALTGCVSFGGKAPGELLTLTADTPVPAGTVRMGGSGTSITVIEPEAAKKLDTVRVPVQVNETSVAYVKNVQWVDTPRHMFRNLLAETIGATGSVLVLDPGQYSADPGRRLLGELIDFGIDARSHAAVVTYDATLATPDGSAISKKRFSASVAIGKIRPGSVGGPLNEAANKVAAEVAAWVTAN